MYTTQLPTLLRRPPEALEDLDERVTTETAGVASPNVLPILAANLRRLRTERALSLERLSKASAVSRAMLSQIELGYSAPTINVIWRIASALGVPFGELLHEPEASGAQLLRHCDAKVLSSYDGLFSSRALFPSNSPRRTELYELRLRVHCAEQAEPHAAGTVENLVVAAGRAVIGVGQETFQLERGDALQFEADVQHSYINPDPTLEAVLYLTMSYANDVG